jgi:hypothetical protein
VYGLKQKRSSRKTKKLLVALATLLIVAIGALSFLEATDRVNFFGKKSPSPTIGPQTKGEIPDDSGQEDTETPDGQSDSGGTKRNSDGSTPSKTLFAPSGNFVSNHNPNMSGKPAPNLIQSVCVTTPGATCTITFTKDGTTKSLPNQTADGEGATYWDWKLQDIGLSAGEWKIQAKATLNGQTKTTDDPLNLRVAP